MIQYQRQLDAIDSRLSILINYPPYEAMLRRHLDATQHNEARGWAERKLKHRGVNTSTVRGLAKVEEMAEQHYRSLNAGVAYASKHPDLFTLNAIEQLGRVIEPTNDRLGMASWRTKSKGLVPLAAVDSALPPPAEVPRLLNEFLASYRRMETEQAHAIARTALIMASFEEIRPFDDGSYRVGFSIAAAVLGMAHLPVPANEQIYFDHLNALMTRNSTLDKLMRFYMHNVGRSVEEIYAHLKAERWVRIQLNNGSAAQAARAKELLRSRNGSKPLVLLDPALGLSANELYAQLSLEEVKQSMAGHGLSHFPQDVSIPTLENRANADIPALAKRA